MMGSRSTPWSSPRISPRGGKGVKTEYLLFEPFVSIGTTVEKATDNGAPIANKLPIIHHLNQSKQNILLCT